MLCTDLSTEIVDCFNPVSWIKPRLLWQVFTVQKKGVECAPLDSSGAVMKFRDSVSEPVRLGNQRPGLPMKVALWLLDQPHLGKTRGARQIAGNLLKAPARQGVVEAQSRLGQLLCLECGSSRDRRIGIELLRQAARAGDLQAQALSESLSGSASPVPPLR